MAATKKTTTTTKSKATPAKKEATPVDKTSEVKTEVKAAAEEVKEPVKKTATRKTAAKQTAEKPAVEKKTEAAKKETVRKTAAKVKETVHLEFSGKTYTPEDLLKSCRDVWKYDLSGKEEDIKEIELYVKPDESVTYYVINGEVKGSFNI